MTNKNYALLDPKFEFEILRAQASEKDYCELLAKNQQVI